MQRSFYLIFLSVLLSFSFSNDGFAAAALVSKAETLPSQTILKKQEKKLAKLKAKFQKLQKLKSWKLVTLTLLSCIVAGLVPLIAFSLLATFAIPIIITALGFLFFLDLKKNYPKAARTCLIVAIALNLVFAAYFGFFWLK